LLTAFAKVIDPVCATGKVIGIFGTNTTVGCFGVSAGADCFGASAGAELVAALLFFGAGGIHLRHTFFLPSLLHTYLKLGVSKNFPTFGQADPIFGAVAAEAPVAKDPMRKDEEMTKTINLRIVE
jgi:hypothetical protein